MRDRAVERRRRHRRAQHRFRQAHRQLAQDVALLAGEDGVRLDGDLDERVARFAAILSGIALAFEAQGLPVLDAGGDGDLDGLLGAERNALLGPEGGLDEGHGEREFGILPAPRRARTLGAGAALAAQDLGDDVVDRRIILGEERPGAAAARLAPRIAEAAFGAAGIDLAAVEPRPLLGVGQQIIGGGHLLELLLDPLVAGIEIGMQPLGEPAVAALDVLGRGGAPDAERLVRIFHCRWVQWAR